MCTRDFPFSAVLSVAYDSDSDDAWGLALFSQFVSRGRDDFLKSFQLFKPVTRNLCASVAREYMREPQSDGARERMCQLIASIPNLIERYRLAKDLGFGDIVESMKSTYPVVCEWCEKILV